MSLRNRIKRLEAMLGEGKVSWQLKDGSLVEVFPEEIIKYMPLTDSGEVHPLLDKIRNADPSTYGGDGTLLGLAQAWLKSVEEYRELNDRN